MRKEERKDILSVTLERGEEKKEKMKDFIRQIQNPYSFWCGDVLVELVFLQNGPTMEEQIQLYLQQRFG